MWTSSLLSFVILLVTYEDLSDFFVVAAGVIVDIYFQKLITIVMNYYYAPAPIELEPAIEFLEPELVPNEYQEPIEEVIPQMMTRSISRALAGTPREIVFYELPPRTRQRRTL